MTKRKWYFLLATGSALGLLTTPGIAAAQEAPDAPASPQADDSKDIVVTSIRRSLETAQAIKRDSDQIVDSVVAEDIGKLPDVTAAESLARITGIQVDSAQGEASGVRLRGLPDLETTYNGREIFTAEGRSVALQDFPSASISRIDVYKSSSADLIEPGIAGLIDVRSHKPFDFNGTRVSGSVSGVHWYQSQKIGLDASALVSTRWHAGIGEMGLLIEGSYADVNFLDSARNVSQTILSRTGVAGTAGAIRYPSFVNIDYQTADRWRPSAHTAFQWRPSNNLEIYLDGLFQGFRGKGAGRNLNVGSGPAANLSNIVYFPGTNLVQSMTATAGALPTGAQNAIDANTDTYQFGGGFVWHADDRMKVTGDVAWTDSTYTQYSFQTNFELKTAPTRNLNFDNPSGAGGGTVTLSNYNLFDPSLYRLTTINDNGSRTHGRDIQARLDVEYRLADSGITKLQAGIRFNSRDADSYSFTRTGTFAPVHTGPLFTALPLDYASAPAGFRNDQLDTVHTWLTPTRDSLVANEDYLRTLVGLSAGRPGWGAPVYVGNEKSYSGYLQAHYAVDLGIPVDGLVGIRAIRTEDQINGVQTVDGVTTPISRSNAYNDFLPNVSARLKFTGNLQLRLAFTQTRTRPGFGSLNPSTTIGAPSPICATDPTGPECLRTATTGNPDLKPVKSTNYDTSLEYYFSKDGSITVGAFHRDLTGFINNVTTQVIDPTYGRLSITGPQNGGKGRISGVEAGFRTFFRADWLPHWMRDFGVLANYTYLDHKSELAPGLAATLPGMLPLAGVSSHLVNVAGFYENRWISLRAAYNYRSSFVVSYGQVADPALNNALGPTLPISEKGRGTVDISGTVNPTSNVSINFSISNLFGASASNARQFDANVDDTYPWQTRFLESVYRLGVRFRF